MINYPQLIRHEWFDLGKKMTLPDCMNYIKKEQIGYTGTCIIKKYFLFSGK